MGEVQTEEGYSLDFVVEWRSQQIAIKVDGPSHFVGRTPNGATLLKRRLLRHLGWRLVSIPYWEWSAFAKERTAGRADKRKLGAPEAVTMQRERQKAYLLNAITRSATATAGTCR